MAEPYLGEIKVFAGNFAPVGWGLCNGQVVAIDQNTALFSLLGTTYGGNGVTTFALPDLQGRALIHQGEGPATSNYIIGETGGVETVRLTAQQLPLHTHPVLGIAASATAPTPGPNVTMAMSPTGVPIYGAASDPVKLSAQAITAAGGGQPHENRQPNLGIAYIIAMQGIFPARS